MIRIMAFFITLIYAFVALAAEEPYSEQRNFRGEYIGETEQKVKQLLKNISTINLVNALYLQRSQAEEIIKLSKNFYQASYEIKKSLEIEPTLIEANKIFQNLYNEIQKGEPARGEISNSANAINKKLKKLHDQYYLGLTVKFQETDFQLQELLSDEQILVIVPYKACLIPPKDLKNPVRAGQIASNSGTIKKLRKLKRIKQAHWKKAKNKILSENIPYLYKKYRLKDDELKLEIKRIGDIVERVRQMDDAEFELEKENLAAEISPADKYALLKEELNFRKPKVKKPKKTPLLKFILADGMVQILQERIDNNLYRFADE